jgi:hypothetical protein
MEPQAAQFKGKDLMNTPSIPNEPQRDLFGRAVYFSPDPTDPYPHAGFCVICGAPAPLRRIHDGANQRSCWDPHACAARVRAQDDAHLDTEHEAHFGGAQ